MSDLSTSEPRSLPVQDPVPAPSSKDGEAFLRLQLVPSLRTLLPVQQLAEVLTIPIGRIVPIPQMPVWVMGVYNWRGEVLWMVDLGHLCGLTPWYQRTIGISAFTAIVLRIHDTQTPSTRTKSQVLGLVVNQVEDIELCDSTAIQSSPTPTATSELGTFLRGYWRKSDDDVLAVLDGEAIMTAMPKR
ncbi:MAG: chemotaxis protein CheW [Leptolyngbyaceae cyanobacterium RU_5_1]|nr:chemotaxis protein CheW [Leptolyngbyaceae cyanobacterium RU_5_1]